MTRSPTHRAAIGTMVFAQAFDILTTLHGLSQSRTEGAPAAAFIIEGWGTFAFLLFAIAFTGLLIVFLEAIAWHAENNGVSVVPVWSAYMLLGLLWFAVGFHNLAG